MLLALLSAAAGAPPPPCELPAGWSACLVAADLHPVGWSYVHHYERSLDAVMAGPRASPLFTSVVNEADVHWRLYAATGRGLDLSRGKTQLWTDLALAGSFLAFDRMLTDMTEQSEEASAVRTTLDAFFSPAADITFRPGGKVRVEHPTGGALRRRFDRQADEAGLEDPAMGRARERADRQTAVRIRLAAGWSLRDLDADPTEPLLSWAAELSVRNAGISLWRADLDLVTLQWSTIARQELVPRLSVGAGVHSETRKPAPERWSAGLYWTPLPRAVVSLQRFAPFSGASWRVDLSVQVMLGGHLQGEAAPHPLQPNCLTSTTASPTSACGARR